MGDGGLVEKILCQILQRMWGNGDVIEKTVWWIMQRM